MRFSLLEKPETCRVSPTHPLLVDEEGMCWTHPTRLRFFKKCEGHPSRMMRQLMEIVRDGGGVGDGQFSRTRDFYRDDIVVILQAAFEKQKFPIRDGEPVLLE